MKSFKVDISEPWKLVFLFFGSIMTGCLFLNILVPYLTELLDVFSVHKVSMELLLGTEWERLFVHVFLTRSFQLLLIGGVLFLSKKPWILYIALFGIGAFFGMTISAEVMMLGWIGVLYAVLAWMPQYLCYILTVILAIAIMKDNRQFNPMNWSHNLMRVVIILAFLGLGCLLETTINTKILHWCYQYLVDIM